MKFQFNTCDDCELWDEFIEKSVNGTFLQTKNFLNYHPEGRYEDASTMIKINGKLVAVVPGCTIYEGDKKIFWSHKGSTFGGIITNSKHWTAAALSEIIEEFDIYLRSQGYDKAYLKITPSLFCRENSSLLEYLLYLYGYDQYSELNTYIDFEDYNEDIVMNFNDTKRKHIRRLKQKNLVFRKLRSVNEICDFYHLLELNLSKFKARPIHSVNELIEFKYQRLINQVEFYGVFLGETQLAGGMMFDFGNGVIHAQNLSTDPGQNEIDAIEYLYYGVIKCYKELGYKYLSWGISTENQGQYLNYGLIRNKESYGSKYYLNKTFYKKLGEK